MSNLINWYTAVLKNYTGFTGRARRAEFWWFTLANLIISIIISIIVNILVGVTGVLAFSFLSTIYSLAVFCPTIAVGIRRMHDIGRKGWWILVPLYNLYLWSIDSEPGENLYGPNPKGN